MAKAQVGIIVGVVFLVITFVLLSFFWPLINTMFLNVASATPDAETALAWRLVPFSIIILAILGMFYYRQKNIAPPGYGGGGF